jgi:hypothetical protein
MFVWAGWLLAAYFAYLSAFSPSDLGLRDYRYNVNDASMYAAFSPIVCSLALSWLIWACFTGHGGKHETNKPHRHHSFPSPSPSPPSWLYSPVWVFLSSIIVFQNCHSDAFCRHLFTFSDPKFQYTITGSFYMTPESR